MLRHETQRRYENATSCVTDAATKLELAFNQTPQNLPCDRFCQFPVESRDATRRYDANHIAPQNVTLRCLTHRHKRHTNASH